MAQRSGSDEESLQWIIATARSYYEENIYKAKSWLLTGSTMFPENISLKMEFYKLAKSSKLPAECGQYLAAMVNSKAAKSHKELQAEVSQLVTSIQHGTSTPNDALNCEIFSALPEEQQCLILQDIAAASPDALSKCSVLLLLIKRYPKLSKEYGTSLVETLFEAELNESPKDINNTYRRYFVSEALPLMLKENVSGTDRKVLLSWLDKALQFYILASLQPSRDGMSPMVSAAGKKPPITRSWEGMADLLSLTSKQVKWTVIPTHYTNNELMLSHLNSLRQRLAKEHSKSAKKEFVYNALYLWLKLVNTYNSICKKSEPICLVQKKFNETVPVPKKHRKVQESAARSVSAVGMTNGDTLVSTFKQACEVWHMINSDGALLKAFDELLDRVDSQTWISVTANFSRDRMLYQQDYQGCLKSDPPTDAAYSIQRACCQYALGKAKDAAAHLVDVLGSFKPRNPERHCPAPIAKPSEKKDSGFVFLTHPSDLFTHGVRLLIHMLKNSVSSGTPSDNIRGHLCVLLQCDWPQQKPEFLRVADEIKANKSFVYPCFFDYIINIEMLEEFAFMKSDQGGNVSLELQPVNLQKKQRAVTRGVAKDVKEDFKALFEKQVARSSESMTSLITQFLEDKRKSVLAAI